jgi:hypothetical protein
MRPVDYAAFVEKTKQFASKPADEQRSIALYGLVSEIGSLVAAVKKKLLSEGGEGPRWDQPNDEIKEELGDSLWYCYSAAHVMKGGYVDILAGNIEALRAEMSGSDDRAHMIEQSLDPANRKAFLVGATAFPPADGYTFDDYQRLAYKTARTDGRVLLEVCLALLWQHGAELLRAMLPATEVALHTNVANRDAAVILGGIACTFRRSQAFITFRSMTLFHRTATRCSSGRCAARQRRCMMPAVMRRNSSRASSMSPLCASDRRNPECISREGRSGMILRITSTTMTDTAFTTPSISRSSGISAGLRSCAA